MTTSNDTGPRGLSHIGIHSEDPATLAVFYQDVLDMQVVGSSAADSPLGASTFLSSRPDEESHEIVIFANRDLKHTAFKVSSLADLCGRYRSIKERGVPIKATMNHGVSLAFYFDDPEGNMIEIYWPTGLAYGQPYGHAIDLTLTEEELLEDVAKLAEREGIPWPE